MKATLHFILRTDRPRPDGSAIIYLRLTINRRNKFVLSIYRNIPLKKQYGWLCIFNVHVLRTRLAEMLSYLNPALKNS